jgi:hypothetical protein
MPIKATAFPLRLRLHYKAARVGGISATSEACRVAHSIRGRESRSHGEGVGGISVACSLTLLSSHLTDKRCQFPGR